MDHGACLYYKLPTGAFGSGELKKRYRLKSSSEPNSVMECKYHKENKYGSIYDKPCQADMMALFLLLLILSLKILANH